MAVPPQVLYHLPDDAHYIRVSGVPRTYSHIGEVPLSGGYLIAPFVPNEACPLVLIEPERVSRHAVQHEAEACADTMARSIAHIAYSIADDTAEQRAYHTAFLRTKVLLQEGELGKLVLSRRLSVRLNNPVEAEMLFHHAVQLYPHSFVAMWHTHLTGTWLCATPEPLLCSDRENSWHTVALAGTMPLTEGGNSLAAWSRKNREEQALVARYIEERLRPLATRFDKGELQTRRAAALCHLCTPFSFSLPSDEAVSRVIAALHPTPAVCGVPQTAALSAITSIEPHARRYYAGYSGPFFLEGSTALYVSLRCMSVESMESTKESIPMAECLTLYAGGGIMPQSNEADEWTETRRKLQTMLRTLG